MLGRMPRTENDTLKLENRENSLSRQMSLTEDHSGEGSEPLELLLVPARLQGCLVHELDRVHGVKRFCSKLLLAGRETRMTGQRRHSRRSWKCEETRSALHRRKLAYLIPNSFHRSLPLPCPSQPPRLSAR